MTESERVKMKKRVTLYINGIFGTDLSNLSKAKELHDENLKKKLSLQEKLTFASSEAPGMIETAVIDAESVAARAQHYTSESSVMIDDIHQVISESDETSQQLQKLLERITELQQASMYLRCLAEIEDLSSDIQSALMINQLDGAVSRFGVMSECAITLQSSNCHHLKTYVTDTLHFWYNILKDKIASDWNQIMTAYGWPFIVSSAKLAKTNSSKINIAEVKGRLNDTLQYLLRLQLPTSLALSQVPDAVLAVAPDARLPPLAICLLLEPLQTRFKFHFNKNKSTNKLEKPEWYLTTVLNWIRDHKDFLITKIQPVFDTTSGFSHYDVLTEFCRGLVFLVIEKLSVDIKDIMYDDQLFSHLVDEVIAFSNDMDQQYGYPSVTLGPLHVLARPEPFTKWIHIERKYAVEKMDQLFSNMDAWQSQYVDLGDVDGSKLPQCADIFVTLMMTITDRYKSLSHAGDRLQFVDLQLELLDDFRIRLLQIRSTEATDPLARGKNDSQGRFISIMNTALHIATMLAEWRELPFFIELQFFKKSQPNKHDDVESLSADMEVDSIMANNELSGSLFDDIFDLYELMSNDMIATLTKYIADDVQARSMYYRKDTWVLTQSPAELHTSLSLSNTACEMLLVLRDHLHYTHMHVSHILHNKLWMALARKLDDYLYNELVLQNHFNESGGIQLKFDMTRNLFPLFGQYTSKPENYFKHMKESCALLSLKRGSAILLRDLLRSPPSPQHATNALTDIGVHRLTLTQAAAILASRVDLMKT